MEDLNLDHEKDTDRTAAGLHGDRFHRASRPALHFEKRQATLTGHRRPANTLAVNGQVIVDLFCVHVEAQLFCKASPKAASIGLIETNNQGFHF
jgi:hypothetical protein